MVRRKNPNKKGTLKRKKRRSNRKRSKRRRTNRKRNFKGGMLEEVGHQGAHRGVSELEQQQEAKADLHPRQLASPIVTQILRHADLMMYAEKLQDVSDDDLFDIYTKQELIEFLVEKGLPRGHAFRFYKKSTKTGLWTDLGPRQSLTDFEKEFMNIYCHVASHPFNLKLRGVEVSTSTIKRISIHHRLGKKTIDDMINAISSAINKSPVTKPVFIYRGLDLETIDEFRREDPSFKSFTTDIELILYGLGPEKRYINDNGCCVLCARLERGAHAYYDDLESQYVLDKDTKFSEPIQMDAAEIMEHTNAEVLMYSVQIMHK